MSAAKSGASGTASTRLSLRSAGLRAGRRAVARGRSALCAVERRRKRRPGSNFAAKTPACAARKPGYGTCIAVDRLASLLGPFDRHATAAARGQRGTIVSPGGNGFARDPRATKRSATRRALLDTGRHHSLMLPMLVCHRADRTGSQRARLHKKRVSVSAIMGLATNNQCRGTLRSKMATRGNVAGEQRGRRAASSPVK